MQFCVCCIGFQEALLRYVRLYTDGTDSLTITFHSYPTIIWFVFGVRFMIIALFCPIDSISDLATMPFLYDLGFEIPFFEAQEELELEKEAEERERERKKAEAKKKKEQADVIVDVLVDEEGNLVVDEEGQYVTIRTRAVNSTTEAPTTARTPIPLTVPPAQMSDPFNPFTGNFG